MLQYDPDGERRIRASGRCPVSPQPCGSCFQPLNTTFDAVEVTLMYSRALALGVTHSATPIRRGTECVWS